MELDRDALRQKLEDVRYRVEGVFGGMDPEKRKLAIRLGIMASVLVVLALIGAIFVWGGGPSGSFEEARVASAQTQTLADTVRSRLSGRSEFVDISINAVAVSGDDTEQLLVYGSVPSQDAWNALRDAIESAAPNTPVELRVSVVRPGDQLGG